MMVDVVDDSINRLQIACVAGRAQALRVDDNPPSNRTLLGWSLAITLYHTGRETCGLAVRDTGSAKSWAPEPLGAAELVWPELWASLCG